MDPCAPERLVGIDVPDAGDGALVEQSSLDRRAAMRETLREVLRPVRIVERLAPDAGVDVRVHFRRFEQKPRSEPAHVAVGDVRPVV